MGSAPAWPLRVDDASSRPAGPRVVSDSAPEENTDTFCRRLGFPRRIRLLSAHDYQRVFAQPERSSDTVLSVLARTNTLGYARLGMAISRKVAPKAHQRNRIKRVIRESFRHLSLELTGIDFVVMARTGVIHRTNNEIRASIEHHLQRLVRLCANS
ncbi:MAG: ribonuclease P protein component [Proteobacteria bacterium]|nr:MAG: ribonuclease P protein component [Pseudomonadota bacterium]